MSSTAKARASDTRASGTRKPRTSRSERPPANYPQGLQTVTFADMEEDTWWELIHALSVRIRFHQERRAALQHLDDPGLQRQVDHYDDTLGRLHGLLVSAQRQIGPSFFGRIDPPALLNP